MELNLFLVIAKFFNWLQEDPYVDNLKYNLFANVYDKNAYFTMITNGSLN